jgi:ElaB/YqjD/DUF883 family membrane-anchored ribosome-binding protein
MTEKAALNQKVKNALETANDAIKEMKKKGESTKIALSEDFQALKEVFSESNVAKKLSDAKEYSVTKVKDAGTYVDQNVREKPYYYIGGAALIGLLIGLLISRKN